MSSLLRMLTGRTLMNRQRRRRTLLMIGACAVGLLGAGCMVGPNYHRPETPAPPQWTDWGTAPATNPTTNPTSQPSVALAGAEPVAQWWMTFNDAELNSLVQRAVQSNLDLREASARLRQARALRSGASSGLFPQVDLTGSYSRSHSGGSSSGTGIVTGTGGTAVTVNSGGRDRDLYQAGFDATWELDVFGGVRRDIEATSADLQAAVEDRRDVLVTLLSEVARNYIDLRGFQQQIAIAQQNLIAQRHTADITQQRFAGGFVAGLDVANAEAQVATTASQIPVLESSAQQSIYALGVLLGGSPAALTNELQAAGAIPPTPPEVPVGLPSDLLRRRPDIRRSERQLAAATARVGVATADLFPHFSLTGSLGLQGSQAKSLGNWDNRFWSIGPSVSWPVLDFGRIQSNIEVQNALEEQALVTYQRTVLTGLQDVENALVAYAKEQQHRQALTQAVAANRRAVDLATQLYTQGLTDFLNVLDAQRSLFGSQDALVQSDRAVSGNLVALYKALGGGWEADEPPQASAAAAK